MTLAQYLLGVVLMAAAVVPVGMGAVALRTRLLPGWGSPPARLAEAVIGLALVIGVAQVLGLIGLLHRAPFVAGCALAGIGVWRYGRPVHAASRDRAATPSAPAAGALSVGVAMTVSAVVLAVWIGHVVSALDHGMARTDTLWYHLPQAARFVQTGSTTDIQFFDDGAAIAYAPGNASLVHAAGMLFFGRDTLSPLINLGWLTVVLLSAWCIGRPKGVGLASLLAVAGLLVSPILVYYEPGQGYNDVVGLALILAAVALLVNGGLTPAPTALAGLAAGVALGTKVTLVGPVAALTIGVVVAARRGGRGRTAVLWTAPLLAASGFWYLRNLLHAGSPVPPMDLHLGPISFASPPLPQSWVVADYITDSAVWSDTFQPGIEWAFGPAWWALLGMAIAGMVLVGAGARSRLERVLGLVAVGALVAYLFTPHFTLGGAGKNLFLFRPNLRYVTPALAMGLTLLPLAPLLAGALRQRLLLAALGAVAVITLSDSDVWTGVEDAAVAAGLVFLVVGAAYLALRNLPVSRPPRLVAIGLMSAIGIAVGWPVERAYVRDRYTDTEPLPKTYRWARGLTDSRIAIVGFYLQYPLLGVDLSNRVQYVGREGPHGAFSPIRSCQSWRRALNDGGYRYVVTAPPGFPVVLFRARVAGAEAGWTESDPAATLLVREYPEVGGMVNVFRLDGPTNPGMCPGRA